MVLVRLLPMILVPTGKDFGELLLRMDEIDAGDQSILRVLLTAITLNKDQRLQPSQVLKLVSGIKQSGIQFA